jgi:hypothetical protein
MMRRNTPSETSELPENKAARITVQRITEVISRRRKIAAFEGVWAGAAASDIRAKIAGAEPIANSQLALWQTEGGQPPGLSRRNAGFH